MVSPQNRLAAPRAPATHPGPGTIPPSVWGSVLRAPTQGGAGCWCRGAPRLRARVGLLLGAGPDLDPALVSDSTYAVLFPQHSSYQVCRFRNPSWVSRTFAVTSMLHWELCVKFVLPTNAVMVETPYITFA